MTTLKCSSRTSALSALVPALSLGLLLIPLTASSPQGTPSSTAQKPSADPRAEAAKNVRLVGYNDLQGRQSLQVVTKSDAANGSWVYVGHSPNNRTTPAEPILNPITGRKEWNGTSILDISDPSHPKFVWHIPNDVDANSRSVSVVYDYRFESDPPGRDYLIRNSEAEAEGGEFKFQIFDITTRGTDPSKISLVSEIKGTPEGSCGPGCGGKLFERVHKGYWSQQSGLFYSASREPGFRSSLLHIWDLKNPKTPKLVGRGWLPGQKEGEPGFKEQMVHHPIVDEQNKRVYIGDQDSGKAGAFDITDIAHPKLVWVIDTNPPARGPHTVSPIVYNEVPNFKGPDGLPRTYAFITEEAMGPDTTPCKSGIRSKAYMIDITSETHPFPVSTWQVPVGNFCDRGGRFGPHQHAETVNGELNRFEDKLAWVAYFNAGIRVVDLSDPYNLKEVGYYLPRTTANSHPMGRGQKLTAIQINDVDIDHRGLAYATDRVGTGLFVLQYTGPGRRAGASSAK